MPHMINDHFFAMFETVFDLESKEKEESKMRGKDNQPLDDYFEMTAFFPDGNRRWLTYVTAHIYFEDLHQVALSLG